MSDSFIKIETPVREVLYVNASHVLRFYPHKGSGHEGSMLEMTDGRKIFTFESHEDLAAEFTLLGL